jgi:hypothetical protein
MKTMKMRVSVFESLLVKLFHFSLQATTIPHPLKGRVRVGMGVKVHGCAIPHPHPSCPLASLSPLKGKERVRINAVINAN